MLAFFFFDMFYLIFMAPFLLLAGWASWKVKATFNKYNKVPIRSGISGVEAAQMILRAAGLEEVQIREVHGMFSDHYNPMNKTVNLSREILLGKTPAAVAVAAHECGHALQHQARYAPMELRSSIVPVANIGSKLAWPMIFIGAFLSKPLAIVGVILFALVLVFHLITLPVEFDASRRAIRILENSGVVASDEMPGVRKTLFAAGFTYVAAAIIAAAELIFWLFRLGLLGGGDD